MKFLAPLIVFAVMAFNLLGSEAKVEEVVEDNPKSQDSGMKMSIRIGFEQSASVKRT